MTSSSRPPARVLRPGEATVVGRPSAVATERVRTEADASARAWKLDDLASFDFAFGAHGAEEHEPSLSTAPTEGAGLDLIAAEIEAARAEAYAQGLAEGRARAEQELAERLATATRAVADAVAAVQEEERRWIANAEENIVALAAAIARHVIDREVAEDPAPLRALVARALGEFPLSHPVTVRLHPDDLALLHAATDGAPLDGGRAEMVWTADARLLRGGCVVEGRDRIIDGRVDTALERLYRRLTGTTA